MLEELNKLIAKLPSKTPERQAFHREMQAHLPDYAHG
jgi:hypothetical protein